MKYIVLDDEIIAADYLAELIKENDNNASVTVLNNPVKALEISFKEKFDVCFIDIQMPGLNGIEFAGELKKVYPKTNFIFVTGYSGERFRPGCQRIYNETCKLTAGKTCHRESQI